jgi:hypothetical protein
MRSFLSILRHIQRPKMLGLSGRCPPYWHKLDQHDFFCENRSILKNPASASSMSRILWQAKECQRENCGKTKTEKQIEMRKTESPLFSAFQMPTQIEAVTPTESFESESQNIIYDSRVDIQTLIATRRLRWHSKIFENHCDEVDWVFGSAGQLFQYISEILFW